MYIHVKANAGAKSEEVVKVDENHFKIKIKEKAERNMANKRIIEILVKYFDTNNIRLINGHNSPSKLFAIDKDGEKD